MKRSYNIMGRSPVFFLDTDLRIQVLGYKSIAICDGLNWYQSGK
ncbi:hypothetical protein [Clostridium tetani]|nr:hypothetical protein [Clostridium tetani]